MSVNVSNFQADMATQTQLISQLGTSYNALKDQVTSLSAQLAAVAPNDDAATQAAIDAADQTVQANDAALNAILNPPAPAAPAPVTPPTSP